MAVESLTESFLWVAAAIPFFAYIRNAIGIFAETEAEFNSMMKVLKKLGIPVSYEGATGPSVNQIPSCQYGTFDTQNDWAVQCGDDNYVLPNGMTSGKLKDAIERG
jgi:hypothetical protein